MEHQHIFNVKGRLTILIDWSSTLAVTEFPHMLISWDSMGLEWLFVKFSLVELLLLQIANIILEHYPKSLGLVI